MEQSNALVSWSFCSEKSGYTQAYLNMGACLDPIGSKSYPKVIEYYQIFL